MFILLIHSKCKQECRCHWDGCLYCVWCMV